ncbi:MAG TPA: WYL domain-containing protein [Firmicutes bacterium]|nr:WYL domain-containing protein [Bacillota bacterium]
MPYSELVKNFEKIREYMREFYVYGFKSRGEYNQKSARSYDDERRRIESWLGEYMRFAETADGRNYFISVDSRAISENPFYKAWKTKSFTDGDITLHFAIFDVLWSPDIKLTLAELTDEIDSLLSSGFDFDESTLRKKLKEYADEGIIVIEKRGRQVIYSRAHDVDISGLRDVLDFFSEVAPCGVIGSFLCDKLTSDRRLNSDKMPDGSQSSDNILSGGSQSNDNILSGSSQSSDNIIPTSSQSNGVQLTSGCHSNLVNSSAGSVFCFKHHYITEAIDSDVMASLFDAMRKKSYVLLDNFSRRSQKSRTLRLLPLKIYISVQNGRQHLIAYNENSRFGSYRLDYISNVRLCEPAADFDRLRAALAKKETRMWGVMCGSDARCERVELDIYVGAGEEYIVNRLEREKRCGSIEKIDNTHYRYTAEVYDSNELLPWIRTFISRITRLKCSNRAVENRFREDVKEMYHMYQGDGGDTTAVQ